MTHPAKQILFETLDTVDQLFRYCLVIALMVVMISASLIVCIVSADLAWRIFRGWNQFTLWLFGVTIENRYDDDLSQLDTGGVILGLNQQSLLDPTAGYAAWNRRVLSVWNIEYSLIPFFGWITVTLGWIIVRQWPEQAKKQLGKAAEYAAEGGLVYLSAEGKRSRDGSLSPYKKGPIVLAINSQAPIHPLYIYGSRDCLPVGAWKIRPGKISVHYLPAIKTEGLSYEDRNELLAKVRAIGEAEHAKWIGR